MQYIYVVEVHQVAFVGAGVVAGVAAGVVSINGYQTERTIGYRTWNVRDRAQVNATYCCPDEYRDRRRDEGLHVIMQIKENRKKKN